MTRELLRQALDALSPLTGAGDRELCDAIRAELVRSTPEPVALVTGAYGGRATYRPLDPTLVLPVGMALYAAPQAQPAAPPDMVLVTRKDANNYCRILTMLGMEEEGDPLDGVRKLIERVAPAVAEPDCRTCKHQYAQETCCLPFSVPRCTNGDCHTPLPPVRLWKRSQRNPRLGDIP